MTAILTNPFPHDPVLAGQWYRAVSHTGAGGAEIGECLATGRRVAQREGDVLEVWLEEWFKLGDRLARCAEDSAAKNHKVSALSCYLRASNYYRTAYTFHLGAHPFPSKATDAYRRHAATFEKATTMMPSKVEVVEMDYPEGKGKKLRGYLFHPLPEFASAGRKYPLLIVNGGYDSTAEENYFYGATAALARGYVALTFDGPGQGKSLLEDGLFMREDWEVVVRRVIDYAVTRTDVGVDASRIALMGVSFGGYLAPRAATGDERISAVIADPGQYSLLQGVKNRIPGFVFNAAMADPPTLMTKFVDFILEGRAKHPTRGWAIRRGLFVHGLPPDAMTRDYFRATAVYTLEGRADKIKCPMLICAAEKDEIASTATALYDSLTSCPNKRIERFTDEEDGAGGHCEAGARAVFTQRVFDWLDEVLKV